MRCLTRTNSSKRGGILAVTLFLAFLFGYFLFYYLSLAKSQKALVKRSEAWNGAMGQAEAGVEEALAQLNPGAPQPVLDLTVNGWGAPAGGLYGPMSRSLSNGSYSVVFTTDPMHGYLFHGLRNHPVSLGNPDPNPESQDDDFSLVPGCHGRIDHHRPQRQRYHDGQLQFRQHEPEH
jgi:hypothetical protein